MGDSSAAHLGGHLHRRAGRSAGRAVRLPAGWRSGLVSLENGKRARLAAAGARRLFSRRAALEGKRLFCLFTRGYLAVVGRADRSPWPALIARLRYTAEKVPPPSPLHPRRLPCRPIAARAFAEYASCSLAPVTLRMERDVGTAPTLTPSGHDAERPLARIRNAGWRLCFFSASRSGCVSRGGWCRARRSALEPSRWPPPSDQQRLPLNATIAEHWLYVPGAFLFLAVAFTLLAGAGCGRKSKSETRNSKQIRKV